MADFRNFFRKSMKTRLSALMSLSIILILIGALLVLWSTMHLVQKYKAETDPLKEKLALITAIAEHSNETVLRARGYLIYLEDFELQAMEKEISLARDAIAALKLTPMSKDEEALVDKAEPFLDSFGQSDGNFKKAVIQAKVGRYDAIRELIKYNPNSVSNQIISMSAAQEKTMRDVVDDQSRKLIRELFIQSLYFMLYIAAILLISIFIARRVAKDIGNPIGHLAHAATRFARGEHVETGYTGRVDEIGVLSRSLEAMMENIGTKEEELVAQNEELQAQQDELQAQQEELTAALRQMEENEQYLAKQNRLIQSLATTLDKQELLQSIVHGMVEVTGSDKGIIKLINEKREYATFGLSEQAAEQFVNHWREGIMARILETLAPYTIEREATQGEKGYHTEAIRATDILVPILGDNNHLSAIIMLTRVGKTFGKSEEAEILSLARQVSLALAKMEIYAESESERQLNTSMLNTIQEGVQLMNLEGVTLHVNMKWLELLNVGGSMRGTAGMTLDQFKSLLLDCIAEPEPLLQFVERIYSGAPIDTYSMNYEISVPVHRYVQIYCEPLYRGGTLFGYLLVHRDITKEYEVDRMKSEFVSTVSHELRTPLASVLGFAELLLHRELKPERQRKYVSTIYQEARRLTALINDFLDLQRMESGKQVYDMQPLELPALLRETIDTLSMGQDRHRFIYDCDAADSTDSTILGDRDKMTQVFTNLLSNAVKYSPNGGDIRVRCERSGNRVIVTVKDEGLGIPEEAIPQLFTKFFRVDNTDRREIGGTGLGLAIVKEIVGRHKGDIAVQSEPGKGSTFTIALPFYEPEPALESDAGEQAGAAISADVMLVENDRNLSIMLRDELQNSGFRVHLYTEGKKALEDLPKLKPDVLVVDLMLEADVSGWSIIEAVRSNVSLEKMPIVISSAFEEQAHAADLNVDTFLVKPYPPAKLTDAIRGLLKEV